MEDSNAFKKLDVSFAQKDVNPENILSKNNILSKFSCKNCSHRIDLTLQKEEYFTSGTRQYKCDNCDHIIYSLDDYGKLVSYIQNVNLIKRLYMFKNLPPKIMCKTCQLPVSMRLNPFYDHLPDGTPLCHTCRGILMDINIVIDKPQKLGVYIKIMGNTLRCSSCKSKTKLTSYLYGDMFSPDCIPLCPKCHYLIFTSFMENAKNCEEKHDEDNDVGVEFDALPEQEIEKNRAEEDKSNALNVALKCSRASINISGIGEGDRKARNIEAFKRNLGKGVNCVDCEHCRKPVVISKLTIRQFNSDGIPICPNCNKPVNLDDMNMENFAQRLTERQNGSLYLKNAKAIKIVSPSRTSEMGRQSIFNKFRNLSRYSTVKRFSLYSLDIQRRHNYSIAELRISSMIGIKPPRPFDYSRNEYSTFYGHECTGSYDRKKSDDMKEILKTMVKPSNIFGTLLDFKYNIPEIFFRSLEFQKDKKQEFSLPPLFFYKTINQPLKHEKHDRRILLLIDESDGARTAFKWYLDHVMNKERDFLILLCLAESNRYRKRNLPVDEVSEALLIRTLQQKIRRLKIVSQMYSKKVRSRGLESHVLLSCTQEPVILVNKILKSYKVDFTIIGQQPHAQYLAMYTSLTKNLRTFVNHPIIVIPYRMKYHAKSRATRKIAEADLKSKNYLYIC